jgi:glycerophosphoryl diester phosphodiesterase
VVTSLPLIVGHRGASGRLPENTLAAFRGALEDGADGVELDVRLSADGVPVVVHDATLYRTLRLRARVAELSAARLAELSVPSLEAVLDLLAPGGVAYVELKGTDPALPDEVARLLARRGHRDRAVVLSFNHTALRRVRDVDERVTTAATFAPSLRTPRILAARLVDSVERAGATSAALHVSLATRRRVDALRERGLGVAVWTVNSATIARRLERLGVDAMMTDHPARLVGAREVRA